jgi:HlyD family secretion protein
MIRKWVLIAAISVGLLGGASYYLHSRTQPQSVSFRTSAVEKGPVVSEVSCTGTVNPVMTVKVGAEVTGKIKEILADFNSQVTTGQLIARIDPEAFEVKVRQEEADLVVAVANVAIRRASLERAKAELENAESEFTASEAQTEKASVAALDAKRELNRMKALRESQSIPIRQFEQAEAAYGQAVAQLNSAKAQQEARECAIGSYKARLKMENAQLAHAEAQVERRRAALADARIDLEHTAIRSPLNGTVISREVDVGQTVVARLQAPLLFTIAQDLRKMQVEASVDEADIGRIHPGRRAIFTVDTFPGRKFSGVVDQIRKAPHEVQNVVTYTVIIASDNRDLALLPGMTATVRVVVKDLKDVLKVPNAALRFRPPGVGSASGKASPSSGESGGGESGSPKERMQKIIDDLRLTKEQQDKVWALFKEAKTRVFAQMSQGAGQDQIRIAIQTERQRMKSAVAAMLTPEQKKTQARLLAERNATQNKPGRVWIMGKTGTPEAVDLVVGITDGSCSQVVSGDLQEGQEVLVVVDRAHN